MIDYKQVAGATNTYISIISDIMNNTNLELHLKDVEDAICNVDTSIDSAKTAGTPYDGLERLKNELFYLKYEILERL